MTADRARELMTLPVEDPGGPEIEAVMVKAEAQIERAAKDKAKGTGFDMRNADLRSVVAQRLRDAGFQADVTWYGVFVYWGDPKPEPGLTLWTWLASLFA